MTAAVVPVCFHAVSVCVFLFCLPVCCSVEALEPLTQNSGENEWFASSMVTFSRLWFLLLTRRFLDIALLPLNKF